MNRYSGTGKSIDGDDIILRFVLQRVIHREAAIPCDDFYFPFATTEIRKPSLRNLIIIRIDLIKSDRIPLFGIGTDHTRTEANHASSKGLWGCVINIRESTPLIIIRDRHPLEGWGKHLGSVQGFAVHELSRVSIRFIKS